jgi:endogenous inhibitor of DNA gyrase (YacG/DUF329 family)
MVLSMTTRTIVVCDVCGEEAVGKRTIDVCSEHSGAPARRRGPKPTATLVKCPTCGKEFKAGAGLALHQRRVHATAPRKQRTRPKKETGPKPESD